MTTLFCIKPKGFNIGNDVIYIGMQHFLYRAFKGVVNIISLPATSTHESHVKAGLTSRTIHEINQYADGVIVGGGNLYENGELDTDVTAFSKLEVPLMLFSLSRGRIYNRRLEKVERTDAMPDEIMRALNTTAACSLARDRHTTEYLQGIGCKDAITGGCPTVFLNSIAERLPELPGLEGAALISVRQPSLMNIPLKHQSRVRSDVKRLIQHLRDRGHADIRLLCHDHRDIPFAATIEGIEYIYTEAPMTFLAILKTCALNVSYRLHGSLPCMSFGTPVVNISYDERASSLMETVGLGEWDINLFESDDLVELVEDRLGRLDDLSDLREKACSRWGELYRINEEAFAHFSDCVMARPGPNTPGG